MGSELLASKNAGCYLSKTQRVCWLALAFGIIIHACLSAFYTGRKKKEKKVDATSIFFTVILNIGEQF